MRICFQAKLSAAILNLATLILTLHCVAPTVSAEGLSQEPRPESWKLDAALTDIYFLNSNQGWAVGSQGTLLRTSDGGKTWSAGNLQGKPTAKVSELSLAEKIQRTNAKQWVGQGDSGPQSAPFSCRFESVHFTDARNGWAVGGYELPAMNYSRAVIARTSDGGETWRSLPRLMVPRLHQISMSNHQNANSGWAVGECDPETGSSLFFTSNGGSIWSAQATKAMPSWIETKSLGQQFIGIDDAGQLAVFDTQKVQHSVVATQRPVVMTAIDTDPTTAAPIDAKNREAWSVGCDGVVVQTENGGISWNPVHEDDPRLANFDFRCVEVTEQKVWFAGDPGNVLFSIDRSSGTLQTHVLPRGTGINKIHFSDEAHGWAVGDFGLIVATTDGGSTWQIQRTGSQRDAPRAGILVFCRRAQDLPLELIGKHAGDEGKLVSVIAMESEDSRVSVDAIRLAAERLGAATVSSIRFDPQSAENQSAETVRLENITRKLVRTIRLLKPTVLVGRAADIGERFDTDHFLDQAIALAASETAFPEQLANGLTPWQTRYMLIGDAHGDFELDRMMFLPRLGMLLEDIAMASRLVIGLPLESDQKSAFDAWRYVGTGDHAERKTHAGNPITQNKLPRRQSGLLPAGNLASIRLINEKRQSISMLLRYRTETPLDEQNFRQRLTQMTMGLGTNRTGNALVGTWLFQLAQNFLRQDQPEQAAWTLEHLAMSAPKHALAPLAAATLAKYYSSDEMNFLALKNWEKIRRNINHADRIANVAGPDIVIQKTSSKNGNVYRWNRQSLKDSYADALKEAAEMPLTMDVEAELANFDPATVDLSLDDTVPDFEDPALQLSPAADASEIEQAGHQAPMNAVEQQAFFEERYRMAASHFARLSFRDPNLVKRSDFRFVQAHIVRQVSSAEEAEHYFRQVIKHGADSDPQLLAVAIEETRDEKKSQSAIATATLSRPHLDGLPNDDVWQQVIQQNQTLRLRPVAENQLRDIAMLAWDQDHFYVYVRCYKLQNQTYTRAKTKRLRDADLSLRDRVSIEIDVDRDVFSSWRIGVDYRGQVHESCSGIEAWNPKMFVAHHQDERVWALEIAIPLNELSSQTIAELKEQPWRIGIERTSDAAVNRGSMLGPQDRTLPAMLLRFQ